MKGKCLTILTLVLVASLLLTPVQATLTRYIWDNVHFIEGRDDQHDIKYPHPDRDYYSISVFSDWTKAGTKLFHNQINYDTSQISGITLVAICAIAGAVIGTQAGPYGSVIGAVAGAIMGVVTAGYMVVIRDEQRCIWWWTSISFVSWLADNAWWLGPYLQSGNLILEGIAIAAIEGAFVLYGYLRIGDGTIYDAVGAGSPPHTLSISASDHGTTDPAPGSHTYDYGEVVTVKATADYGYGFDYWDLDGGMYMQNPIEITMDQTHTLEAHFKSTSGGGGCPTLFVWNGTAYVEEGALDIHAESDVTVQHYIENSLALENRFYKLQLWELDNHTSHIDQVKLYAVDYEGEWHLCPLTYAYHSELGKVKHTLRFDDDSRVDLKPTEIINLKFAEPECETAYFIFEINGYNPKNGWYPT